MENFVLILISVAFKLIHLFKKWHKDVVPLNTQNYTRMYIYKDIVLKKERISRMNYLQIMLIFRTEDSLWVHHL